MDVPPLVFLSLGRLMAVLLSCGVPFSDIDKSLNSRPILDKIWRELEESCSGTAVPLTGLCSMA